MAAIGQIRKHYGLLVVIIGVAMAAFIMGDLFKSRTRQSVNIGAVNGEEISYKDFSVEVEKAQDAEKTNKKKAQLNSSEVFRIKQNTWKRMVKDIIMKDELDELGLTVTSDELYDLVQGEHPHRYILQYFKDPATGQYKPEMVRQYLQNLDKMPRENQLQWIDFEKAIKEDQLNTKFNNLVAKAYYLPKEFAKMVDAHKSTEVEVQYVAQLYSSVNDDKVSVTDADYQKYYDKHKEDFKREETRDVDYVVFDVKPTADDREAQKRKFDEYYSELKTIDLVEVPVFVNSISDTKYADKWFKQGELPLQIDQTMFHSEPGATVAPYMSNNAYHCAILLDKQNRPDSLKASHILIAYSGATGAAESVTRIKPQAKSLADSLLKVLQKNPNKIEELAIALSDDPGVKQNKGHYDWFADGRMVPEFNQACLDNKKGSVVVVETVYGFHVIRVDGQKDYSDKVKVAMVDRAIEPSNQTYQQVYVKANEFASKCKSSNFDDVAEEMGLSKRTLSDLTAMQETIPGQKDGRQIVIWAYKPDRALNDLNLFDMNGSYLVTTLSNIKEKGYASLDEVKQNISSAVKNTKKGDYIIDQINKSANKENLVQLASEIHTAVDTTTITFETSNIPGFGPEFDVIGAAAAMTKGEFLGPIKGSKAVFVMKAIDYRPATAKTSYKALIDQMNNRFKSAVNFRLYNAIEKQADIEDNRHTFY